MKKTQVIFFFFLSFSDRIQKHFSAESPIGGQSGRNKTQTARPSEPLRSSASVAGERTSDAGDEAQRHSGADAAGNLDTERTIEASRRRPVVIVNRAEIFDDKNNFSSSVTTVISDKLDGKTADLEGLMKGGREERVPLLEIETISRRSFNETANEGDLLADMKRTVGDLFGEGKGGNASENIGSGNYTRGTVINGLTEGARNDVRDKVLPVVEMSLRKMQRDQFGTIRITRRMLANATHSSAGGD